MRTTGSDRFDQSKGGRRTPQPYVLTVEGIVPESPNEFMREALDWFDRFGAVGRRLAQFRVFSDKPFLAFSRSADRFGKIKEKEL